MRRSGLATTSGSAGTGPGNDTGVWLIMTIILFALLCNYSRTICLIDVGTEGETLHLTGTKKGCDHGQCGACTVHINGRRANSCLLFAAMQQKAEITTIEGLGTPERMHPVQAAFVEHDAYQCGYCTSGQIMSAAAMLKEPWGTADADVREAMSGNICRCGAYPNIVAAVQACRKRTA